MATVPVQNSEARAPTLSTNAAKGNSRLAKPGRAAAGRSGCGAPACHNTQRQSACSSLLRWALGPRSPQTRSPAKRPTRHAAQTSRRASDQRSASDRIAIPSPAHSAPQEFAPLDRSPIQAEPCRRLASPPSATAPIARLVRRSTEIRLPLPPQGGPRHCRLRRQSRRYAQPYSARTAAQRPPYRPRQFPHGSRTDRSGP